MTIETKVIAGAAGSGIGAAVASFVLWLLGVLVWHVPSAADFAGTAIGAVPTPVAGIVAIVISITGGFLGGYLAPHTDRPDLTTPAGSPGAASSSSPAPAAPAPAP